MNDLTLKKCHPTFKSLGRSSINALNIEVEHFEHQHTGAMHYHMEADDPENVFLVALRTVPTDSTGVAHILEHTALCGSERFPVRDPFFMMLRRSLNTFMNAFTSSDWTAYPFATQNRKDFGNLLEVYLDAVFFSRLDQLDFCQEGHRLEFDESDNTDSNLVFKGVVYNEMKGAMSSITSTLWQTLCHHLFPNSTYHFNSGGDPVKIPDLTYEKLLDFYQTHYHPSNSIFMTYGNIPAIEHQTVFEEKVLSRFERLKDRIEVKAESRFKAPAKITETYAYDSKEPAAQKTHIVIAWLLGESTNLLQRLEAQLLASALLDNSAAPLRHFLETTPMGLAPSPLCGIEDSMREMVFCCGLEGSEAEYVEKLELEIVETLKTVASLGIPEKRLEAVLHQLELQQREITGDSYPYGLSLILQGLSFATHYKSPVNALDIEDTIRKLQENIKNPKYIRDLAENLLLKNNHRITLTLAPDTELSEYRNRLEMERLKTIKESLSTTEKKELVKLAADLRDRQMSQDDESVLPKLGLKDVPNSTDDIDFTAQKIKNFNFTSYNRGTNGLIYQQAIRKYPHLDTEELKLTPYYITLLTELGINGKDYLSIQERQSDSVGSIHAFSSFYAKINDEQDTSANLVLSSNALARNLEKQTLLMTETINEVSFVETDRIRDIISQKRAMAEQSVTGNGHSLAMIAACAGMSPVAELNHKLSGLEATKELRRLDKTLSDNATLLSLTKELKTLHEKFRNIPIDLLLIAEETNLKEMMTKIPELWKKNEEIANYKEDLILSKIREKRGEFWIADTQVNFCAKAYPTVPSDHPDSAPLTVLGGFLRNGFLHRAIREQGGAYGGGASQDSSIAAFRFFSYRDPRLSETLDDFEKSIYWLLEEKHDESALEQAILGVISSLDKPGSPAGDAKRHFHNQLSGRTHDFRENFRKKVLDVKLSDLRNVTEKYLKPELSSTAILSNSKSKDNNQAMIESLDLNVKKL